MPGGVPDLTPRFSLDFSPKENWVDKVGGLPPYIASIATALMEKQGFSREHAIATAVNTVKKWCVTGRAMNLKGNPKVSVAVRAAACQQVASWEAKKARA